MSVNKEDNSFDGRDFSKLPDPIQFGSDVGDFSRITGRKSSLIDLVGFLSGVESCYVEETILITREKNKKRINSLGKDLINNDR